MREQQKSFSYLLLSLSLTIVIQLSTLYNQKSLNITVEGKFMGYGRKSQAKKMNQRKSQAKKKSKLKAKIAAAKTNKKK